MKIEWINHASFLLAVDEIKLVSDPWIEGRVFNHSWELISPTQFSYDRFEEVTHIWFSHEHPDHFSPPNILKIPLEYRAQITILFQVSEDSKVIDFCTKAGFKEIIVLTPFESLQLSKSVTITNGKVQNDTDSWLHIKVNNYSILNLNDCILTDADLNKMAQLFPNIDLLLTQFSFANWVGNSGDIAEIQKGALEKREEIKKHICYFNPTFTIPFASYVWFCHPDNVHLNEHANDIGEINQFISSQGSFPIVLYPGDTWNGNEEVSNELAIKRYSEDKKEIPERELTHFNSVRLPELTEIAQLFVKKALTRNNRAKLRSYEPMNVFLTDLQIAVQLSYKKSLVQTMLDESHADISMHSQSFSYCITHDWGFDTLFVAATFSKPENGNFKHVLEYQWVSKLNNEGKRMKGIAGRVLEKLKRGK